MDLPPSQALSMLANCVLLVTGLEVVLAGVEARSGGCRHEPAKPACPNASGRGRTLGRLMYADWHKVIDANIHPTRVMVVAAMEWIDVPVSPVLLASSFGNGLSVGHVGYHVRKLAEARVAELVDTRPVRPVPRR